ncbi:prophage DNA circulation protein [Duganella sp. SG902]|uniref:DNA circularization protein n=1 Tax=Duganella sp. SG902 TaxID=2587016 RepID=UPI00159E26A2|nr:DNA circularization N-terminal domain-containing protein [Duganella sp. SG902]NVM78908.1 prophage DNA circulation protein [Duganella sp. SG902]
MSWAEKLLPASFRDIEFDVQSLSDETPRSLARHSYPYTDGTDIEDMGRDERKFSVKAVLWGDDYEERLQALIAALDTRGAGRLIHPIYGVIESAQVRTHRVHHDADNVDYCTVDIEFEESVTGAPFFTRQLSSQAADAMDDAADDAETASGGVLVDECDKLAGQADGDLSVMSRISAMRQNAVTFLVAVNNEAHEILTSITDPIRNAMGFVQDVTALAQALISQVPNQLDALQRQADITRNSVNRLLPAGSSTAVAPQLVAAGSDSAAVAGEAFAQIDRLFSSAAVLPTPVSQDYAPGSYDAWVAAVAASAQTAAAGVVPASSLYPVAQSQLDADTQVLLVHIATVRATTKARVAADVMAAESITPLSAPSQIEQVVTAVRDSIEEAIVQVRARYGIEQARAITEPLKSLAMSVQEAGRAVINARPALVSRTVASPAPLRLLAHRWYGDHSRAVELQRLNNLRLPNATNTGDKLNAYAK